MSTKPELPSEDPIPGRDPIQRAEDRCIGALSQALATGYDIGPRKWVHEAFAALRAALSTHTAQAAEGWQLVPKEPTPEMVARALRECGGIGGGSCGEHTGADADDMRSVWESMLAAAPQPATHTEHAEIQRLRAELAAERERRRALAADMQEYLYRVSSQVPFEHAQWARDRGEALLAALRA